MGGESVARAVGANDVFPRALQIEVTTTAAKPRRNPHSLPLAQGILYYRYAFIRYFSGGVFVSRRQMAIYIGIPILLPKIQCVVRMAVST
jgi:hypothetical protein